LKAYKYILFDLDGTLTDPKEGITKCVQYALSHFDIHVDDLDTLTPFIGPPLDESFIKFYGLSKEDANRAVTLYRERFREIGMLENKVISGIPEVLSNLRDHGMTLHVATSKPTVFASEILKNFNLNHYFESIVGSNLDGTRSAKKEIIDFIMQQQNLNSQEVVMIGDRMHDIIGAKKVHVDSIGVTFGYGSEEELSNAGATYIVHSPEKLEALLLQDKLYIV